MRKDKLISFSVTEDQKKGLKLLFWGKRYSDVFEEMVKEYLSKHIKMIKQEIEDNVKVKEYSESLNYQNNSAIRNIERNINMLTGILGRLQRAEKLISHDEAV